MTRRKHDNSNRNNSAYAIILLLAILLAGTIGGVSETVFQSDTTSQVNNSEISITEIRDGNYEPTAWDVDEAPNFYRVDGEAIVSYSPEPGEYYYSDLDELGRAGVAYAAITVADYQRELTEDREEFGASASTISGWGNNEEIYVTYPDGDTVQVWAFARCHLIADSLGGTVDNGKTYNGVKVSNNLVTGTYAMNVGYDNNGGMAYAENKAREWLSTANGDEYLYYAVTPVYVGDNLVCSSVFIDILSSDGGINEHIEVYNVVGDVALGYTLGYATGEILNLTIG